MSLWTDIELLEWSASDDAKVQNVMSLMLLGKYSIPGQSNQSPAIGTRRIMVHYSTQAVDTSGMKRAVEISTFKFPALRIPLFFNQFKNLPIRLDSRLKARLAPTTGRYALSTGAG